MKKLFRRLLSQTVCDILLKTLNSAHDCNPSTSEKSEGNTGESKLAFEVSKVSANTLEELEAKIKFYLGNDKRLMSVMAVVIAENLQKSSE